MGDVQAGAPDMCEAHVIDGILVIIVGPEASESRFRELAREHGVGSRADYGILELDDGIEVYLTELTIELP